MSQLRKMASFIIYFGLFLMR